MPARTFVCRHPASAHEAVVGAAPTGARWIPLSSRACASCPPSPCWGHWSEASFSPAPGAGPRGRGDLGGRLADVSAPRAQAPPQRIVSLVPAVTEMLFAIGAGPRVVGVSSFDKYPPEVSTRARVGALVDPDLERILSLRPDLVVVYATQDEFRAQLERARIPAFVYQHRRAARHHAGDARPRRWPWATRRRARRPPRVRGHRRSRPADGGVAAPAAHPAGLRAGALGPAQHLRQRRRRLPARRARRRRRAQRVRGGPARVGAGLDGDDPGEGAGGHRGVARERAEQPGARRAGPVRRGSGCRRSLR